MPWLLVFGLALAPIVHADDGVTYVSVYAPGASRGAAVAVQARNGRGWTTVAKWKGNLTDSSVMGVLFTRWEVDPSELGQGPFRAVVFSLDQKSLVATSDPFYLPEIGGTNLAVTVGPPGVAVGVPPAAILLGKTIPAPPRQAPMLNATRSTGSTMCFWGDCANAQISVYIDGLPLSSWIAVEWQNALGDWLPVRNWQGKADRFDLSGRLYKQWAVSPALYGHGPFRWAVYSGPNGDVIGVSPSFDLPATDRANLIMQLGN